MDKNIDFKKLTNAEINLKMMGYDNEYSVKKEKIIQLIHELEDLDFLYNKAKEEIERRGILKDE
jgi:hypothetical protein